MAAASTSPLAAGARFEDFMTLVYLSDWMWAFSFLSLVTFVKQRASSVRGDAYRPLPRSFLLFAVLNSVVHVAGVLYPGAAVVREMVELIERTPQGLSNQPFQVGILVLEKVSGSFEMMLSLCMLVLNLSFLVAELFSLVTNLLTGSVRAEAEATEKAVKEAKAKKGAKKAPKEAEEPTLPSVTPVEPMAGSSKTLVWLFGVMAVAVTAYGCAVSPLAAEVHSVQDLCERLRNFIPCNFGLFALLETLALVANPQVLFVKVDGKLRATAAAHAAMIRVLALVVFMGANSLRMLPDPVDFVLHQAPEAQIHILVQVLHFAASVFFLLPKYAEAHPTVSMLFFLYVATAFACIANPKLLSKYDFAKRDLYIKATAIMSCGMGIVLNSSYSGVCIALVAAVFINLHRAELDNPSPKF